MKNEKFVATHRTEKLRENGWIRLKAEDKKTLVETERRFGIRLSLDITHAVEDNGFVLLPVRLPLHGKDCFTEIGILMALGRDWLITVEPDIAIAPFNRASSKVLDKPGEYSSHAKLVMIVEALIDAAHDAVDRISMALDDLAGEAVRSSGGFELKGKQAGVADIADTAVGLGQAEELIARTVQGQLMIERSVRWLRRTSKGTTVNIAEMLSDIQGSRRQAQFQHAKVRNIQQSLMTTLDLKQNQIIKVFTIITAVFTPPTLIAAFYGQNFAYMPELALPWGEWVVMASTAFFAMAPLIYIKRKGWLR
jgi:magnesium transporter